WLSGQQVAHGVPLLGQLGLGGGHPRPGEVVDLEALDDLPVAALAHAGEGVDQALLDTVAAVGVDPHADPVTVGGTEGPGAHVADGGVGGGGGGGGTAGLDDGGAALLDIGDEGAFVPVLLHHADGGLDLLDVVVNVGVLGVGMVATDSHVENVIDHCACFLC